MPDPFAAAGTTPAAAACGTPDALIRGYRPAMTDVVGDGPGDEEVRPVEGYGDPGVLALVALVLAVLVICGFGVLAGPGIVAAADGPVPTRAHTEAADVVSVVLAFVPLLLGLRVVSRGLEDDPRWVGVAARSAVLLALFTMLMRLGLLFLVAANVPSSGGLQFYNAP